MADDVGGDFPIALDDSSMYASRPFRTGAPLGRRSVRRGDGRCLHAIVRLTPGDEAVTIRSFFATVFGREALFEKRRIEVDRGI